MAPRSRRADSVRDQLEQVLHGSAGVDELVHGLLGFLVDLAHAQPRHPLLTALTAQLGQAANGPMIAAAIHDLRAVLQGVGAGLDYVPGLLERSGALQLAELEPQRVDGHRLALALEAVEDARAGIRAAAELAAETLAFHRDCVSSCAPSSREPVLGQASLGPTALAEVIRAAMRLVGRHVDLRLSDHSPPDLWVQAPRRDLLRVLINLLRNAVQAIGSLEDPRGAAVSVAVWASDELAFVQVADDGPGIPAAALDAIFDLFFTTHGEGTGVGLFVCKALVTGWGGLIHAESRAGEGARFTFSVPLGPPHAGGTGLTSR